jgi:hypothetical protein
MPIDWQMDGTEAAKAEPAAWPKSHMLRLDAIDETVPVFTGQFRVTRDIVFGSDAKIKALLNEKGEITISGKLKYQACDDKMCYIPVSVPLEWTFKYQQLDRQRYQK